MPPDLVLLGCYAFVAWVFILDRRKNPYPSAVLWLPTLWMMRCGSRSIDYWFGGGEFGRWDPIFVAAMLVVGLVALARRQCNWGELFANNIAIFLFYGYLILSASWAEEVSNPVIKLFRPVTDIVMALIVATEARPREAIVTMFRRCAILLIPLSVVLIKYFPDLGRSGAKHWGDDLWIGVTTHKNPLGQLAIVSAFAVLWTLIDLRRHGYILRKQWVVWIYLALTVYLLDAGGGNSRSSTSIGCLIIGIVLYLFLGRLQTRAAEISRKIVAWGGAVLVVFLLLALAGISPQALVAGMFGKDATLTDRTFLWQDVIRLSKEHFLLGAGYGAFWVSSIYARLSPEVDNDPMQSHNGYLETYANLGMVGLILLGLVIVTALRSSLRQLDTNFELGRLRLVLLAVILVMNYAEATFPRGTHLWWFGFLVVALSTRRQIGGGSGVFDEHFEPEMVPSEMPNPRATEFLPR